MSIKHLISPVPFICSSWHLNQRILNHRPILWISHRPVNTFDGLEVFKGMEDSHVSYFKSKARNDKLWERHLEGWTRLKTRPLVSVPKLWMQREFLRAAQWKQEWGESSYSAWYCYGKSFSGVDRTSNQPQHSLKLQPNQGKALTLF